MDSKNYRTVKRPLAYLRFPLLSTQDTHSTPVLQKHQAENHSCPSLSVCETSLIQLSIHSNIYCILGRVRLRLRGRAVVLHSTFACLERATPTKKHSPRGGPLCGCSPTDPWPGRDKVRCPLLCAAIALCQDARK